MIHPHDNHCKCCIMLLILCFGRCQSCFRRVCVCVCVSLSLSLCVCCVCRRTGEDPALFCRCRNTVFCLIEPQKSVSPPTEVSATPAYMPTTDQEAETRDTPICDSRPSRVHAQSQPPSSPPQPPSSPPHPRSSPPQPRSSPPSIMAPSIMPPTRPPASIMPPSSPRWWWCTCAGR